MVAGLNGFSGFGLGVYIVVSELPFLQLHPPLPACCTFSYARLTLFSSVIRSGAHLARSERTSSESIESSDPESCRLASTPRPPSNDLFNELPFSS